MVQTAHPRRDDNDPALIERRVQSLIGARKLDEARKLANELRVISPNRVGGWILGAHGAHYAGDFAEMLSLALGAEHISENRIDVQILLVDAEIVSGNIAGALRRLDALQSRLAKDAAEWELLSSKYFQLGKFNRALAAAAKRVDATNGAHGRPLMAVAAMALGRLDEAETLYSQIIETTPADTDAHYSRAVLRHHNKDDPNFEQTRMRLEMEATGSPAQVPLHYAMAKMSEDHEAYETAFFHLTAGARLRRHNLAYKVATDEIAMQQIAQTFTKGWAERTQSAEAQSGPIFVIGLPRTGTTLIDRILGCHSQVKSLGEVNDLAYAVMRAAGTSADKSSRIAGAATSDMNELGESYLTAMRGYGVDAPFLIDKTPANFLYVGMIAKALPGARIIHLRRDPMASGYAMYKTLFRMGYPFSYDLTDLGRYISAYHRLMEHWRNEFPGLIHEVQYEALIEDQTGTTHDLLAYCGLDWEEQCLEFHKNSAPTATASAAQVRQPIYSRSQNLWQNYETGLLPLREALLKGGMTL